MRVAHLVCTSAFAGVERHVATLSAGLARAGLEVTMVGGDGERARADLGDSGATWLPGPDLRAGAAALARLGRLDIVHAHMTAAETVAVATAPLHRARVVATRHFARRRGSSPAGRLAAPVLGRAIAAQLAPSAYVAASVEGAVSVIPAGVPDAPAGTHAERVVLVVQRLEREKDTPTALRAFAASGLAGDGWALHVVGQGSEERALRVLAGELGLGDACRFLGQLGDVAPRYASAGILLATTPIESFGLAVLEAMATGLAVVAAAGGGHLETVGACPGARLFPPGDAAGAGALLAELAGEPCERAAYGAELRRVQQGRFGLAAQVEGTIGAYRAVLGGAVWSPDPPPSPGSGERTGGS